MKRKILGFIIAIMVASVGLVAVKPTTVQALGGDDCGQPGFLGFRPWYKGLCAGNKVQEPTDEEDMKAFVWTIILNILVDLLVATGYAAMIFIIYGGYQFMSSRGDPGKTANGKKTLTSAIIGLVIALSASVVVNTAMVVLNINTSGDLTSQGASFDSDRVTEAFNWAYTVAGIVAVAFIIYGGVRYSISQGDPGKLRSAKLTIMYAVIGLIVVLMAAAITALVTSSVSNA